MNTLDYIVKKYNITLDNRYEIDIPELIGAEGLAHLFNELKFTKGVEIGTDEGEYAEVLVNSMPELQLTCVDPWSTKAYEKGFQPESNEPQEYFNKRLDRAFNRLKPFLDRLVIAPTTSLDALRIVEDNSLDFVYIDGNHDFLNTTQDIHYWTKKVKPGGIVSGHDFVKYPSRKFNHVQKVVRAYTQSYHYLPVFLVTPTNEGMKRDRFRSWFFVKPL